ncbi:PPOX class F420-dependent oxidoreductase [soil metagenome]
MATATEHDVDREALLRFLATRHQAVLMTRRRDGSPQLSPVTCGVDSEGRLCVASYPERAKALNLRRRPEASACVLSADFDGEWVQIDGTAEVLDLPDALEPLVEYFRSIAGEHSDWDEYRRAMQQQGKVLLRLTIERWGPVAKGGFPPGRVAP